MITVISIEQTPNPNALKFVVNRPFVPNGSVTYNSAAEAGADPLGAALFRIRGVQSVFYMDDFITISKLDDADWDTIVENAENAISSTPPVIVDLGPPPATAGPTLQASDGADFESLVSEDRLARINQILDEQIRPALAGDGGGLQVIGLDDFTLRVHYQGACGSCPTSTAGTLMYIERLLRDTLSPKLVLAHE